GFAEQERGHRDSLLEGEGDPMRSFAALELTVNRVLEKACRALLADPVKVAYYARGFDRSAETGFSSSGVGPRGEGERPAWAPTPPSREKPRRELFDLSHEYGDHAAEHRRIFHGQLK